MSTYLFILGKDGELSLAELESRYPKGRLSVSGADFAVFDLPVKIDQGEFNQLGGVIKAGEVIAEADRVNLLRVLAEYLADSHDGGKLSYGISVYGWPEKNLRTLLTGIKKELKKLDISGRFANHNFLNLSAAQYKGLRKNGVELLVAKSGGKFIIARTVAVQDIDSYSKRDYKKPFRDMKVGMLPPKLAQIMINLAGDARTIWDPFCGGGVLLMEGLLMGRDMIGSDISDTVLQGAWENIKWLEKEFGFEGNFDLFVHDAVKPVPADKTFDAIVFEGYLGPPQIHLQSAEKLQSVIRELEDLYVRFFKAVKRSDFKGPIVAALPFFRCLGGLELGMGRVLIKIQDMGFILKSDLLKYARPDQIVGREIFIVTS